MSIDILVPSAGGEYMESVVVVKWHAAPGDAVQAGQLLVTVETAKTAIDVTAPDAGTLSTVLAQEGEDIAVGAVLGRLDAQGEVARPAAEAAPAAAVPADAPAPPVASTPAPAPARIVASPAARRAARARGLDVSRIAPSSPSGRIKLRDLDGIAQDTPEAGIAPLYLQHRGAREGTPVVFLHGLGDDMTGWTPLLSRLRARHPLIVLDLPGHGRSAVHDAEDVHAMADAVRATLQAQAGLGGIHLVGHSLGGAIAILLARRGTFDVHSLALLAPAGLGTDIAAPTLEALLGATTAQSLGDALRALVADPALIDAGVVRLALQARASAALRAGQQALAQRLFANGRQNDDLHAALRALHLPMKIIWGREDAIIPWQHALTLDGRAAVHLLPGVGHIPQLEAPDTVAGLLDELFRSAP